MTYSGVQGQFYSALLAAYAQRGEATAYQYFIDHKLVASDLCVHRNGTVILLKTAYDGSIKQLSPSLLMKEEVYRGYFESPDIRRMEFYGPLIDWQARWTDDIRELHHVNYMTPLARLVRGLRAKN